MVKVTCAPILNGVQPTWLQMMMKQVPERCFSQLANMRGIIDDDVKSFWGDPHSDLSQKLCICLAAFEQLNALSGNEALWQLEIDSSNRTSWEIIAPTVGVNRPCGPLSQEASHPFLSNVKEWGHTHRDNCVVSCRYRRRPNLAVHFAYR